MLGDMCWYVVGMEEQLSFDDLMEIAEIALEAPAEVLEETVCIFRANSALAAPFVRVFGVDVFRDPVERAVICALRLIRWRPFLAGNTEVAAWCMREMLLRSHYLWMQPDEDAEEMMNRLNRVDAGTMSFAALLEWVRERVELGTGLEDEPTA